MKGKDWRTRLEGSIGLKNVMLMFIAPAVRVRMVRVGVMAISSSVAAVALDVRTSPGPSTAPPSHLGVIRAKEMKMTLLAHS